MVENMIAQISKNRLDFTCTTGIQSMIDCLPKEESWSHYWFKLVLSYSHALEKFCASGRNRIVGHVPQPFRALQCRARQVSLLR